LSRPDTERHLVNKHSPSGKRKRGKQSQRSTLTRLGDSVQDFIDRTGISRPTVYRMMADGRLKFIQVTDDMRRIPTSEYVRLGFITDTKEVA
jgi:excisionase family DNA binding protein